MKKNILPHSGSTSRKFGFSAFPPNNSHIMRTVNPFNMNQTNTSATDFRAMKLICLMTSTVIALGTFIYNSAIGAEYQMGFYSSSGLVLGNTIVQSFSESRHEECQADLVTAIPIIKGRQYWIGLYLIGSITIPYQIGFANLGTTFPSQMHSIRDTNPLLFPVNISVIAGTSQKISMWAVCKT